MAGEVGRVAVVVEVVEVGEQEGRAALVDRRAGRLPGLAVALLEGAQLQRRPGQLVEVLLEPRGAPVEPAARRGVLEGDVVEAGAGAEPERHLLADLDAVEAEQVAQRGRAAVVAGVVGVAGNRWHRGRIILRRRGERRPETAARDAHPPAHAPHGGGDAGARQGRQQRRRLVRHQRRAGARRSLEPRVLADLRGARPARDRGQLRGQAPGQAAAAGARGAAAARRRAQLAQLPLRPRDLLVRGGDGDDPRRRARRRSPSCSPSPSRSAAPTWACTIPPTCWPAPSSASSSA